LNRNKKKITATQTKHSTFGNHNKKVYTKNKHFLTLLVKLLTVKIMHILHHIQIQQK